MFPGATSAPPNITLIFVSTLATLLTKYLTFFVTTISNGLMSSVAKSISFAGCMFLSFPSITEVSGRIVNKPVMSPEIRPNSQVEILFADA